MTPLSRRMFNSFQSRNRTGGRRVSAIGRSRSEFTPLLVDRDDISEAPHESSLKKKSSNQNDQGSLQNWLIYWLDSSIYSRWWDVFDTLLNMAFVTSYVVMTTFCHGKRGQVPPPAPPPQYLESLDYLLALILVLQWLPRLYMTLDPSKLLRSMISIFTLLSTLPVIFVYTYLPADRGSFLDGGMIVLLYPLRFWRLHLSLGYLLRPGRNVLINVSLVTQKALNIGFSIFNTLFTVTAWVHLCIYKYQAYYDLTFFDVFYTISVSSTSGLSTQIVPDNYFSRIITLYVMVVGAIFIPTNLSDLLVLIRSKSKYDRRFKPTAKQDHIILVGHFEVSHLRDFLREFYCDDHGSRAVRTQVVLMNPNEPSEELERLLADPLYTNRVKYVKGSTMSFRSLHKVNANEAEAIFILASRFNTQNAVEEDAKMVMRALSIHRFNPKVNVFAHVLMPGSKVHLEDLVDHIICIDEFKMGMLAQNCLAPGFSTLLHLLTTSISEQSVWSLKKKFNNHPWVDQYLAGATREIYAVQLTEKFAGMTFSHACARIYVHFQAVLFAIGVDEPDDQVDVLSDAGSMDSNEDDKVRVPHYIILNPQRYILKGNETAYLITTDHGIASKIADFDLDDVDDSWKKNSPLFSPDLESGHGDFVSPLQREASTYGTIMTTLQSPFQSLMSPPPASASSSVMAAGVPTPISPPTAIPPRHGDILTGMMESPMTPGISETAQSTPTRNDDNEVFPNSQETASSVPDVRSTSSGRRAIQHTDDLIEIRSRRPGRVDSNPPAVEEEAPTAEIVALASPALGKLDLSSAPGGDDGASPESTATIHGEEVGTSAWKRILPYFSKDAVPPKTDSSKTASGEKKKKKKDLDQDSSFPSDVRDHILVCSLGQDFPSNLAYFIAPVRHKEPTKPIIILSNGKPSDDEWDRLSAFGNVYHAIGTPVLRKDLRRARVHLASRAVVLSNANQEDMEDRSADAPALLAVMNIQAMCSLISEDDVIQQQQEEVCQDLVGEDGRPQAPLPQKRTFIIVEFFHPENMKFVGAVSRETMSSFSSKHATVDATELHHHHLIPAFVGGHVFSESMFHSILCQTYYNPHLPYILKLLLFNGLGNRRISPAPSTQHPHTPYGEAASRQNSIESILGLNSDEPTFGNLYQITLPADGRFVGMPYGSLFTFLVHCHSVVALGLYRKTVQLHSRARGNVVKYVVVNPAPDVTLQADDAVFILGEKPIVWN